MESNRRYQYYCKSSASGAVWQLTDIFGRTILKYIAKVVGYTGEINNIGRQGCSNEDRSVWRGH